MDPGDTLIGVAEVALALAGFAAIVLVLGSRGGSLEREHAANLRIMVINSVGSAFFCLFSVAILALEIETPFAWRLLSALGLVALLAGSLLNQLVFLRHLEAPDYRFAPLWWSFVFASGAILLVNTLGVLGPPSFGLLLIGLVVLLSQAGTQFVQMLFTLVGRSVT